ncbi:hypothetical protein P43SY_005827 [Pythium insidiosum]|uniref:DNA/RNA-binding protein Alba-like domain-containing protein n=1 Tax=Pythium insidiosum TaxID=114742 RepID=A0AAD5QAX0_PYTIN|nr:hypothetical protein P43SY_005827 [Pythium insidiosum]
MTDRVTIAVDLDHALAQLLHAAVAWHNETLSKDLRVDALTAADWRRQLFGGADVEETFLQSPQFKSHVAAVAGASEVLKPLRKYFTLYAVTDRPRIVEKATREWLDEHFPGVFDKVLFLDEDNKDELVARKKEIYEDFKVKIAVGADADLLAKSTEEVDHAVLVGSVPWGKEASPGKALVAADWAAAKDVLEKLIQELNLKPSEKVFHGPKLSKYTDDQVTVSTRKPASFYANIINSKFVIQKQETIRLHASNYAIATAIQAAETVKQQQHAVVSKISTRSFYRKNKSGSGYAQRIPKIEIELQKLAAKA